MAATHLIIIGISYAASLQMKTEYHGSWEIIFL